MSGKKAGRGVLRAQARSLKKAWRRVQVNSSLFVEHLLQHLSLGSGSGSSMNVVYERLRQQPAGEAELAALHNYDDTDHDRHRQRSRSGHIIPENAYNGDRHADDANDDDHNDFVAPCCIHMSNRSLLQLFPYHPLIASSPLHRSSACLARSKSPCSSNCLNSPTGITSRSRDRPNVIAECDSKSSATVLLKISIVGDAETGKTSFMAKYVWPEGTSGPEINVDTVGVATQEKVVHVKSRSTHIAFSIWDLGGHWQCASMLPIVCRDAAAIIIMFDLTRRSTLNSVMDWFVQARECNKAAIVVMVGTKYDRFVELPLDIQRAVIQQARVYASAMGAPLFFSSVIHNINVHKVFKVIVAKLFDLPCPIPVNLNFGEPLVDY